LNAGGLNTFNGSNRRFAKRVAKLGVFPKQLAADNGIDPSAGQQLLNTPVADIDPM
jgi:hypothetical protein